MIRTLPMKRTRPSRPFAIWPLAVAALVILLTWALLLPPEPIDALERPWMGYNYHGPGADSFHPAIRAADGVRVDDSMWSIDWPEEPDSILALVTYREWVRLPPMDATDRTVRIRVTGELDLKGGYLRLWIVGDRSRWHLDAPIPLNQDVTLDMSGPWHNSWTRDEPESVENALRGVTSYGLAFVGFDEEVTGWLGLMKMRWH